MITDEPNYSGFQTECKKYTLIVENKQQCWAQKAVFQVRC